MVADAWLGVTIGALCGAAVGTERQWSGHTVGAAAHFGGLRTLTLLGALGGVSGWLWAHEAALVGAILLAGAAGLVVAAYAAASRNDIDGTTEAASLVVLAAGVLAGIGERATASGLTAATVLLLAEKQRLHGLVRLIGDTGFLAGVRFAVMALVVLPLLPEGPVAALGGTRPRQLWLLVLLFSGLSFAGYVARSLAGERRGLGLTGILGGLVSSTSVTWTFARLSAVGGGGTGLAAGAIGASTVLFPRVVIAAGVLHPPLVASLLQLFALPFAIGVAATFLAGRRSGAASDAQWSPGINPLQLRSALQMAVLFQVVWWGVAFAQREFGATGVFVSAIVTGATDVDALTASLALRARAEVTLPVAACAIAVGIAANTAFKLTLALVFGRGLFRTRVGVALAGMAAATLVTAGRYSIGAGIGTAVAP